MEEEGVPQKSNLLKEVVWIIYYKSVAKCIPEGKVVKNVAEVILERSLIMQALKT